MQVDLRVAQLLCSRICHDLIGPVGAVGAGLELLAEDPLTEDAALGLVTDSAATIANRLAFFRIAFGLGGGTGPTAISEARTLAVKLVCGGKVSLDWPEDDARVIDSAVAAGGVKLLLCLVFLATEMLPRGGVVAVRTDELPEGVTLTLAASGQGARVREGISEAMDVAASADSLSAQTVAAHFTAQLAKSLDVDIELIDETENEIRLTAPLETGDFTPSK